MTRIVYLGSEVPSNRKLLIEAGVEVFGWSYMRARKRGFPKTKRYSFADYYPEGSRIIVHPGTTEVGQEEAEEIAADYQDFVTEHLDEITAFTEFDCAHLGRHWIAQQRTFWDGTDQCWPVFDGHPGADLTSLAQRYHEVAIPYSVLESDTSLAAKTRALTGQYDTVWHGLAVASPENLRQVPFATASTLSWASPMMRGETIVWDGTRLARYPKSMKSQARPRYKSQIERSGLDYGLIMGDDAKELTRLAIWSYQQLEMNMDRKKPGNPFRVVGDDERPEVEEPVTNIDHPALRGSDGLAVGNSGEVERKAQSRVPAPREAHEQAFLPVMAVTTRRVVETAADGTETVRDAPILSSTGQSLRQCTTCFVASNCPAFTAGSVCAFSLPVEVKTKDQLKALLNAVIEMQGARVAFAKYAEDLNGGYPDPNTSQEIDRLFKLVGQLKEMEDNKEFVRMTLERSGGAGVLSSIFGDRAQVLTELPGSIDPAQVIRQSLET